LVEEAFSSNNHEFEFLKSAYLCLKTEETALSASVNDSMSNGLVYRNTLCRLCNQQVTDLRVDVKYCMNVAVNDLTPDEEYYFNRNFEDELFDKSNSSPFEINNAYVFACPQTFRPITNPYANNGKFERIQYENYLHMMKQKQ